MQALSGHGLSEEETNPLGSYLFPSGLVTT